MNQSKSGLAREQVNTNHTAPTKNVVAMVNVAGDLTTFAAGIKAAGLTDKLAGKGAIRGRDDTAGTPKHWQLVTAAA
jgi:hypothetical protein